MKTIWTKIVGGPCDGVAYNRPEGETVAYGDDKVYLYRYELDERGRMVWTGESEPLALGDLRRDLEAVTA